MAIPFLTTTLLTLLSFPYSSTSTPVPPAGPHTIARTFSPTLAGHTVYAPSNPAASARLPLLIWGTNACTPSGDPYRTLNEELARSGSVVVACGSSTSALSDITAQAQKPGGHWSRVDTQKLGMLGASCGGADLYAAASDERVLSLAVIDEGEGADARSAKAARSATLPVFYFAPAKVQKATATAGSDFDAIAKGVPSWKGVLPGTDVSVLEEGGAGKMGRAVRAWAQWMVAGDEKGSEFFVDAAGAESEGWTVARKGLGVLVS